MSDAETIQRVEALKPKAHRPPPRPHPSTNPNSYGSGRGCYEVEEEMLSLHKQLYGSAVRRLFQWRRWRLWLLQFTYWPTSAKSVLKDRQEYLDSMY